MYKISDFTVYISVISSFSTVIAVLFCAVYCTIDIFAGKSPWSEPLLSNGIFCKFKSSSWISRSSVDSQN